MEFYRHVIRFWLYRQTKHPHYALRFSLSAILITTAVITFTGALFFYLAIDNAETIALINLGVVVLSLILLILVFLTERIVIISYLLALVLCITFTSICLTFPGDATPYLFWFCVLPSMLVFRGSLLDPIIGVLIVTVTTTILYATINGADGNEGYLTFYRQQPDKTLMIAVVFFFSAAVLIFEYFLINLHEKALYQARFDHLTGLQNRYYLERELGMQFEHFTHTGEHFYILFVDLDRFKEINDLFGHKTGDIVLKQIGERLTQLCDDHNAIQTDRLDVFRFGGDEFVFILVPASHNEAEDLQTLTSYIINTMMQPYALEKCQIDLGVSMGIAKSGISAVSAQELIEFADFAMYTNKQTGKLNVSSGANEPLLLGEGQTQQQFAVFQALKQALARNEFHLVYQPIYHTDTLKIAGCETLIRWHSAHLGSIAPDQFISMAESTGAIHAISRWVLQTARQDILPWLERDPTLSIAINWSPYMRDNEHSLELLHQPFSGPMQKYLANIELEITESAPFLHNHYIVRNLAHINQLGFSLSLDDYGRGSTSLLTLKNSAFRTIKIDRSLLQDAVKHENNMAILKAAVSAVRSLKLSIIAEGVETEEHLALARELECDRIQGFLLSPPIPASQFSQLLATQTD